MSMAMSTTTRICRTEPLHILGAGSIGRLFAASIRSKFPSYPVTLLLRETHRQRLNNAKEMTIEWRHHSSRRSKESKVESVQVPVEYLKEEDCTMPDAMEDLRRPIRNLIVTTKSYQVTGAVQRVLSRLTNNDDDDAKRKGPRIILLCNGALSVKEELENRWKGDLHHHPIRLVLATTTHGAYRE